MRWLFFLVCEYIDSAQYSIPYHHSFFGSDENFLPKRMKQVFVRLEKIILDKPVSGVCKAFIQALPHGDGALAELQGSQELFTKTQWNFCFQDPRDVTINLNLIQEFNGKAYTIAKLVLPVVWFQPDSVVVDTYPMTSPTGIPTPFYAQLSVHLSYQNFPPFSAPPGRLLVIPAWRPSYYPNQQQAYPQPYGQPQYPQGPTPNPPQKAQKAKHKKKEKTQQQPQPQPETPQSSTEQLLEMIENDEKEAKAALQKQQESQQIQQQQQQIQQQTPGEQAKEILQNYNQEQQKIKQQQQMQQMQMAQRNQQYHYPAAPNMPMQYPSAPVMKHQQPQIPVPQQPQIPVPQQPQIPVPQQPQIPVQQQPKKEEVYIPPNIPSDKPAPPPISPPPKTLKNSTPPAPPKPREEIPMVQDLQLPKQPVVNPVPKPPVEQVEEKQVGIIQNPISIFDDNFLPEYPDE